MPQNKTKNIFVKVQTSYQPAASQPDLDHFVFSYRITIENFGDQTVQLLRRHWYIVDSNSQKREVEGQGVIGRQPILEPGQRHEYVSGCNFESDTGQMHGYYMMERLVDGKCFEVDIPPFVMITPYRLN